MTSHRRKLRLWRDKTNAKNYDLSAKNPNGKEDVEHKSPEQIFKTIRDAQLKNEKLLEEIRREL